MSEPNNSQSPRRLELPYRLCDVFTATAFQGNQLAVFEDAGELTSAEMQRLANETNLSEATFIHRRDPATEQREGIRVRIFTTKEELPFTGHPTLGTACTIRSFFPEYDGAEEIVLDLNVGKIPVRFSPDRQKGDVPFGVITQAKPVFAALHEPSKAAAALGLANGEPAPRHGPSDRLYGPAVLRRPFALTSKSWAACRYRSAKLRPISPH